MISNKTFMFKPSVLSVAIAASFVSVSAFSATTSTDSSTDTEDTVVVTAAGYNQKIQNASASISVLTREDIENGYYTDITDAISSIPGVIVAGGGDNTGISIRGMGSDYTLLLIDGQPVNTDLLHPNGGGNYTETSWMPSIQSIERIEVIRGPMSTLYGSNAMGGVINIITRKTQKDWTGNVQVGSVLQEDSNSGNEQNVNFYATGPASENLSLNVYGKNNHRDEDHFSGGRIERTTTSIGSKATYQLNENHQLIASAETSKQTTASHVDLSGGTYEQTSRAYVDSYNKYLKTSGSLEHKGDWGALGTSDTYLKYDIADRPSRSIKVQNWDFKSIFVTPFTSNTLSYGIQGGHERLDDETTNTGTDLTKLSNTTFAIFGEDEWRVLDDVALTLGARYDHDQKYGSHISPRAYAVWNINEPWTLKGGVSTGFRAPTVKESSADWVKVSNGGDQYGNPDLDPETSVTEELTLEYHGQGGMKTSLGVFNNNFKDKIDTIDCTAATCEVVTKTNGWYGAKTNKVYVNIGDAVTRGVEFSLDTPVTDTIDYKTSYTYTYSKITSGDSNGQPLNQLPKHMWVNNLSWQATDNLQTWSKLTLRGKTSEDSDNETVPSYTMVDSGITYQLTDSVKVNAAVYNLFDRTIDEENYGFYEDGRRYWVSMNVDF